MALDQDAVDSMIVGIFDLNRRLHRAVIDLHARFGSIYSTRKTMAKRKRKITDEDVRRSLGEEFFASFERTQRILAERIVCHARQRAEKQYSTDS